MSSPTDSTSLYSVSEVSGHLSTTSELVPSRGILVAPSVLRTMFNDDLLLNRNCSGERGAGSKWDICVGESRGWTTATFRVFINTLSSATSPKIHSDADITEPRLEVEDMVVNALGGDRTAEATDDERERFDGSTGTLASNATPSTCVSSIRALTCRGIYAPRDLQLDQTYWAI